MTGDQKIEIGLKQPFPRRGVKFLVTPASPV